jgi:hypothetical protein
MISNTSATTKNYGPFSDPEPHPGLHHPQDDIIITKSSSSSSSSRTQGIQWRKEMFEQLGKIPEVPKFIAVPGKGWIVDPHAGNGSKYQKKMVYRANVPPKKTLADLP